MVNTSYSGNIKTLVLAALFISLSFIGGNIRIFGTIAFDSLPGFLAALVLGPVYGGAIGFMGHLITALFAGFPFGVPLHVVIGISMAITMLGFGFAYNFLKNKISKPKALLLTGAVGVLLNGPFSLGLSMGAMWVMAGREAALGLMMLAPILVGAAVINVALGIVVYVFVNRS